LPTVQTGFVEDYLAGVHTDAHSLHLVDELLSLTGHRAIPIIVLRGKMHNIGPWAPKKETVGWGQIPLAFFPGFNIDAYDLSGGLV
jgi:hypothetical protein